METDLRLASFIAEFAIAAIQQPTGQLKEWHDVERAARLAVG